MTTCPKKVDHADQLHDHGDHPAALLALTACSNGGTTAGPTTTTGATATTATPAPSEPDPASPTGASTRVVATENEYSIILARTDFGPGTYTFAVDNRGRVPNDLWINGPGVDNAKTPTLNGGSLGEVAVTLRPGTYELWCSIDDHRARGMELTVTAAS